MTITTRTFHLTPEDVAEAIKEFLTRRHTDEPLGEVKFKIDLNDTGTQREPDYDPKFDGAEVSETPKPAK